MPPVNEAQFPNPALAYPYAKGDKGDKGDRGEKGEKGDADVEGLNAHVAAADPHPQYATAAEVNAAAAGAVAGHAAAADPHPQYTTTAEANAAAAGAVAGHAAAADPHGDRAAAGAALAGHVSDADPHPQYTTAAEANAAAAGAVAGHVAAADPHGDRAAASAALAAHAGAADPHPQYTTTAEANAAAAGAVAGHAAAADPHGDRAAAGAALAGHVSDADPHPQYTTAAEANAAAAGAVAGHVAAADPHGDRAAASAALAAHAGAADPHSQYLSKTAAQAALDANAAADRNRAAHTGTQEASTISDFNEAALAAMQAGYATVGAVTLAQLIALNPADYEGATFRVSDVADGALFVIALNGRFRPWQNSAVIWHVAGDHPVVITGDGSALIDVPGSQFSWPGVLLGPNGRFVLYVDASFPDDTNASDAIVWDINGNPVFAYSSSASLETYGALASWGNRGTVNAQEGGGTGSSGGGLGNSSANFPGTQTVQTTINTDAVTLVSKLRVRGPAGATVNVRRMLIRWEA